MDLLSPADVARLLDRHGLAPRRADGQNFVGDPNTVRGIVADVELSPDDVVVEIGAGLGSLTLELARHAARVVAIEVDSGLVRALRETVGHLDDVEVVHADAGDVDLGALAGGPFRLVANLPYHLATPLVVHAVRDPACVDAYVMVQREVGLRWAAAPGDPLYAGISVRLQLVADVSIGRRISRNVFTPVPRVDSLMVALRRTGDPDPWVERVVSAAFARRRRTLRNTLQALAPVGAVEAALDDAGVAASTRAEELPPERFVVLAGRLAAHGARDTA